LFHFSQKEIEMKDTPQKTRLVLALLGVVLGLLMTIAVPIVIQISMERVVAALIEVSAEKPVYSSGVLLFSFAYPLYRGLIFVAGVGLLLLALPIYRGEEWAFPAALLAAAFPSAGGMFMFLPYVSWVDGFPLPLIISFAGLAFFWPLILLRKVDPWLKWGQFLALTFAGMLTTHAFTVGIGNFRMLLTRPMKPLYAGLEWWVLSWSAPVQWISVIVLFVAIYLLAAGKRTGWRLALLAGVTIFAMDVPTQIIRTLLSESTSLDYLYGSLLSAGLLISLLFPKFKARFLNEAEPAPQPVEQTVEAYA
jgi:ABC-type multidrug transport system fused ATPase/permease subunit